MSTETLMARRADIERALSERRVRIQADLMRIEQHFADTGAGAATLSQGYTIH